jgi:hypothetical protein
MAEVPEMKITDADLIKAMRDRKLTTTDARKIIVDTKKVQIEEIEAKEKSRTATSITVEASPDLGEGPWSVVLLCGDTEDDQNIAILNYDPVTKQFLAPDDDDDGDEEEEEEDNGGRSASPSGGGRG